MNKNFDWSDYEELVKRIYENLGKSHGVRILGYGRDCKRKGKSGVEHQIDVLAGHSDGIHNYTTAVECKYWNTKVDKDVVMKVNDIVDDCNFTKGVVVSKLGFTPDAVETARYRGVELVELREPTDEDWKGRVKHIKLNITAYWPELLGVDVKAFSTELKTGKEVRNELRDARRSVIVWPDGQRRSMAELIEKDFFGKLYADKVVDCVVTEIYSFDKGTKLAYEETGEELLLESITLQGKLECMTEESVIHGPDYVGYIMKKIFEGRNILIDKEGNKFRDA